ncbi:MAG: DUF2905 family protein [Armatimonadota bacterium]
MPFLAKTLILIGLVIVAFGLLMLLVGKLPGDIVIRREHTIIYIPIVTSIIISIIITLVLWLLRR